MPIKKFIIVVGDDVAGDITVPDVEKFLPLQEALTEGVIIMEVAPDVEVTTGWVYDGTKFIEPV